MIQMHELEKFSSKRHALHHINMQHVSQNVIKLLINGNRSALPGSVYVFTDAGYK